LKDSALLSEDSELDDKEEEDGKKRFLVFLQALDLGAVFIFFLSFLL
jgi:hypothetical protein